MLNAEKKTSTDENGLGLLKPAVYFNHSFPHEHIVIPRDQLHPDLRAWVDEIAFQVTAAKLEPGIAAMKAAKFPIWCLSAFIAFKALGQAGRAFFELIKSSEEAALASLLRGNGFIFLARFIQLIGSINNDVEKKLEKHLHDQFPDLKTERAVFRKYLVDEGDDEKTKALFERWFRSLDNPLTFKRYQNAAQLTLKFGEIVDRILEESGEPPFSGPDVPTVLKRYHFGIVDNNFNVVLFRNPLDEITEGSAVSNMRALYRYALIQQRFQRPHFEISAYDKGRKELLKKLVKSFRTSLFPVPALAPAPARR